MPVITLCCGEYRQARECPGPDGTPVDVWFPVGDCPADGVVFKLRELPGRCFFVNYADPTSQAPGTIYSNLADVTATYPDCPTCLAVTYRQARNCPKPDGTLANVWFPADDCPPEGDVFSVGSPSACYWLNYSDATSTTPTGPVYGTADVTYHPDCLSCETESVPCTDCCVNITAGWIRDSPPDGAQSAGGQCTSAAPYAWGRYMGNMVQSPYDGTWWLGLKPTDTWDINAYFDPVTHEPIFHAGSPAWQAPAGRCPPLDIGAWTLQYDGGLSTTPYLVWLCCKDAWFGPVGGMPAFDPATYPDTLAVSDIIGNVDLLASDDTSPGVPTWDGNLHRIPGTDQWVARVTWDPDAGAYFSDTVRVKKRDMSYGAVSIDLNMDMAEHTGHLRLGGDLPSWAQPCPTVTGSWVYDGANNGSGLRAGAITVTVS